MKRIFNKQLLAVAIPAILATGNAHANAKTESIQAFQLKQAELKLMGQPLGSTQFIIKYKSKFAEFDIQADTMAESDVQLNERAKVFVENFRSNKSADTQYVRSMALKDHHVVRIDQKMNAAQAQAYMQEMMATGNVEYIELDQMLQHYATPSDPSYSSQWHYFNATAGINAPAAWDHASGAGVTVAVLDTGYRPHSDLVGNIVGGYDMITHTLVENDGTGGRDADPRDPGDAISLGECGTDNQGNPVPSRDRSSSWHGTHVAGTIAAMAGNGIDGVGVAYNAKVVPVRVLGKCGGLTSDIADGIIWASGGSVPGVPANPNPASVINMSLGGEGSCDSITQSAINTARANGAVVVVAAGNDAKNANYFNPGNCYGVVNVAATGPTGARASYSNYGTSIDLAAPGGDQQRYGSSYGVLSTHNTGSTSPRSDSLEFMDGTSMAAPHVAGVAALIKQVKPSATPSEIESILKDTARTFPASCSGCGDGLLDAAAAVNKAKPISETFLLNESNVSGGYKKYVYFDFAVPSASSTVTIKTTGGEGDVDLLIYKKVTGGYQLLCQSENGNNEESCTVDTSSVSHLYVDLFGFSAFSGVTLTAK